MKGLLECKTIAGVKRMYFLHVTTNHNNGTLTADMLQQLNDDFDYRINELLTVAEITEQELNKKTKFFTRFRRAIEYLVNVPGIKLEMLGQWLWVTGDTFNAREILRQFGYYFARAKSAWYFKNEGYNFIANGEVKPLAELRQLFAA